MVAPPGNPPPDTPPETRKAGGSVGLVAGAGRFPLEIARAARAAGHPVLAVGLRELAAPELEDLVDEIEWLYLGEFEATFAFWRARGAAQVVMAGKVPKTFLWERPEAVKPDAIAREILGTVADRNDDSLLGAVALAIEKGGFEVLEQVSLTPELRAPLGVLGARAPTEAEWADIAFGWPAAKALGQLDVGQTVVVQDRAVLALEAVEGTDAAIRRGCALSGGDSAVSVVKVAKPGQDPRFDMPTVGLATLRAMAEGGARALAIEAGETVVVEREALVGEADAAGISVVGVDAASLRDRGSA